MCNQYGNKFDRKSHTNQYEIIVVHSVAVMTVSRIVGHKCVNQIKPKWQSNGACYRILLLCLSQINAEVFAPTEPVINRFAGDVS